MMARELLILAIAIFVGGNLGILMMCLMAMTKQDGEQAPSAELVWQPAKDMTEL